MERERILQKRYGELQLKIKEIQEAHLNSQQFDGPSQETNEDTEVVSEEQNMIDDYQSNNISNGLQSEYLESNNSIMQ